MDDFYAIETMSCIACTGLEGSRISIHSTFCLLCDTYGLFPWSIFLDARGFRGTSIAGCRRKPRDLTSSSFQLCLNTPASHPSDTRSPISRYVLAAHASFQPRALHVISSNLRIREPLSPRVCILIPMPATDLIRRPEVNRNQEKDSNASNHRAYRFLPEFFFTFLHAFPKNQIQYTYIVI